MESHKRSVSSVQLFPLIIEQLEQGRRVQFTVSGSSMMPWIVSNRDSVELTAVDDSELKAGDIVLFCPFKDKYVLHRIIKARPCGFLTAGDGNLYPDGWTPRGSVIAKAVCIYRKGKKIDCGSRRWKLIFRIWMLGLPVRKYLLAFVGYLARLKRKSGF